MTELDQPRKRSRRKRRDDPGGTGFEIVRELLLCSDYASEPDDG